MNHSSGSSDHPLCELHHGEKVSHVCIYPTCLIALCPKCIKGHNDFHKSVNTYPEIELVDDVKKMCSLKLRSAIKHFTSELDNFQMKKRAPREEDEYEFEKLQEQKKIMIETIEMYFRDIQQKLIDLRKRERASDDESTIELSNKLRLMINNLDNYCASIEKNQFLKTLKNFFFTDFEGELKQIINTHLESEKPYGPKASLELNGSMSQEIFKFLEQNVNIKVPYNIPRNSERKTIQHAKEEDMSTLAVSQKDYFDPKVLRQYLHFFQHKSKYLHLLDLEEAEKNENFEFHKVELAIDFKIPRWHRSIITPFGEIYLTGGVDSDDADKKLRTSYVLDYEKSNLIQISEMKLGRSGHALVYHDGYLYAIGGFSEEHDFTARCERYNIRKDTWSEIASLNFPANNPSACSFNDRYIYKFGGKKNDEQLCNNIERYNPLSDSWTVVNFDVSRRNNSDLITMFSSSACCQINSKSILIFGGTAANYAHKTKACYVLTIDRDERVDKKSEENRTNHVITSYNNIEIPIAEAFWNNQAIVSNRVLYCLQNIPNEVNNSVVYLDRRRVLTFSGPEGWRMFH